MIYIIYINLKKYKFKKIGNILYSKKYHLRYDIHYEYNHTLLNFDFDRINNNADYNNLNNHKYLFLSLCYNSKKKVNLGILNSSSNFNWTFKENCIYSNYYYLSTYKNKLIISKKKTKWLFKNNLIQHIKKKLYITCDFNYNLYLTNDINLAVPFNFENNIIFYIKPNLLINVEKYNIQKNINYDSMHNSIYNSSNKINICILLAAGNSTRFNLSIPKQLFKINNIPIINYSIDVVANFVDHIIIVTNSKYFEDIKKIITDNIYVNKISIIINDIDCRLESLEVSIKYISENYCNINNIIIHDVARPFILHEYIKNMLIYCNEFMYSQYYLKLTNGLIKKNDINYEMVSRDDFIEITTPICINYNLLYFLFMNYIKKSNCICTEFIPLLNLFKIKYKLIEGHYKYLKKITTIHDI